MKPLRLGVIGLSPGNGHPYSWSAICNGYDPVAMEECGFPVIPRYLEKQSFPGDAIPDVQVTHVWTQDPLLSKKVARAALIEHVADRFTDMLGAVDGVLLARDDAETHVRFAEPFLKAGVPVYVDKPLATQRVDAEYLISLASYPGQLFSCSALRYAKELQLDAVAAQQVGAVRKVHAVGPKDWETYAAHVIEPVLLLAPQRGRIMRTQTWRSGDSVTLQVVFESGFEAQVSTVGSASTPLGLRVLGESGWRDLIFSNAYPAFKAAIEDFLRGVRERRDTISHDFMLEVVDLIERAKAT